MGIRLDDCHAWVAYAISMDKIMPCGAQRNTQLSRYVTYKTSLNARWSETVELELNQAGIVCIQSYNSYDIFYFSIGRNILILI